MRDCLSGVRHFEFLLNSFPLFPRCSVCLLFAHKQRICMYGHMYINLYLCTYMCICCIHVVVYFGHLLWLGSHINNKYAITYI